MMITMMMEVVLMLGNISKVSNCESLAMIIIGLSDPDAKNKFILAVVLTLTEPNRSTAVYVLDHLIRYEL